MDDEFEKKAAELAFDVTKQFLALALAGIAFVVGISTNNRGQISPWVTWAAVVLFGLSAAAGLIFLMHGVHCIGLKKSYDVQTNSLRSLSLVQIVLLGLGTIVVLPTINTGKPIDPPSKALVEITLDGGRRVTYQVDSKTSISIDMRTNSADLKAHK